MAKKNEELTLDDLQEQHRQYAEVIGIDNLLRLSDTYGGTSIYIPQRRELLKNRTYNAIYREFDGSNVDQLVKKYGVSKSTIYKIVGDRLGRGGQLPGQMSFADLEGAAEDLKNKAMILQTGIDLQALLRLLVDKGIISREEIREYRNEVSGSPKWGAAVSFIEQAKAEIEHYEANPRELLAELLRRKSSGG